MLQPFESHPKNAPGPFAVERYGCIACMAPHHVAPDLMGFEDGGADEGCYFRKQPETEEELRQAIEAVWVSCCGSVQYRGGDEAIRQRLCEKRME